MLKNIITKRKAQALAETAIFGTLLIVAFSFLLTYIQKLNGEDYTLKENFRRTLKDSQHYGAVISKAYLDDTLQVDTKKRPSHKKPIMRSASSQALWAVKNIFQPDSGFQEVVSTSSCGGQVLAIIHQIQPARGFSYRINHPNLEQRESLDFFIDPDSDVEGVNVTYATGESFFMNIRDGWEVVDDSENEKTKLTSVHHSVTLPWIEELVQYDIYPVLRKEIFRYDSAPVEFRVEK